VFTGVFASTVHRVEMEGDISVNMDARVLAKCLISSLSGLNIMIKTGATPEEAKAVTGIVDESLLMGRGLHR
jgi:hypothetical protein